MVVIAEKNKDECLNSVNFWKYFLKSIISKSGESSGRLLSMNFTNGKLVGLIIWKSFHRIYISSEYIKLESKNTFLLTIDPVSNYLQKRVFDINGKYIGKVVDIDLIASKNECASIYIKKKVYSKLIRIGASQIETSKKNIILRVQYD